MTKVFDWSKSQGVPRLVLLALADAGNDEGYVTAYARSQSWLAMKANCTPGSVRRAVDTLEALGEIEVLRIGKGRKQSDYRVTIPGPPLAETLQDDGSQIDGQTVQDRESDRAGSTVCPPAAEGSIIPSLSRPLPAVTPSLDDEFDSLFWPTYPNHAKPTPARAAYKKAREKADCETINAGNRRYASEVAGSDMHYIAHASTWLNQERWLDAPGANVRSNGKTPVSGPLAPIPKHTARQGEDLRA
jgi:DNA-binding MarR family transcriptional regulator